MKKLLAIFICITLTACTAHRSYSDSIKPKPSKQLRVATYNFYWNNGTCTGNIPNAEVKVLRKINADFVLLQEVSNISEPCLIKHLTKLYPYTEFRHHCKEGGMAILSKYPYKTLHYRKTGFSRFPIWVAKFRTPYGPIQAANVHLEPQVNRQDEIGMFGLNMFSSAKIRKNEINFILQHLNPNTNTIIAGDFNESDFGGALKILRKNNFCDAINLNNNRQHTWEYKLGPLKIAQRYDRIFSYGNLAITNVQIIHEGKSDHYPVFADLKAK